MASNCPMRGGPGPHAVSPQATQRGEALQSHYFGWIPGKARDDCYILLKLRTLVRPRLPQRVRGKLSELPSVISGELSQVPETPGVGNIADRCVFARRSELATDANQSLHLKVLFRGDAESLVEAPSKRSLGRSRFCAELFDRLDFVGTLPGDTDGGFDQSPPNRDVGAPGDSSRRRQSLDQEVARPVVDGLDGFGPLEGCWGVDGLS